MERGCLSLSAASSSPSPAVFRRNAAHLYPNSLRHSIPATFSSISNRRNVNLSVKALNPDLNIIPPSWLPKFRDLDTTNMLLSQRIIYLGAQLDDMTADFIITQLLLLDAEDQEKDITLLINSPGGSNTAGMGIYDAMKTCKADVSTINMGLAAYTSAFLLAAGAKGKRFCMPNARVVLRQPRQGISGSTVETYIRLRELNYSAIKMAKILSRITGRDEEQIMADTKLNYYLSAWEAKEYGLVDAVIDDGKPGLVAPYVDAKGGPSPERKPWFLWQSGGRYADAIRDSPDEDKLLKQKENRGGAEKELSETTS